jgi:hypothetical protein
LVDVEVDELDRAVGGQGRVHGNVRHKETCGHEHADAVSDGTAAVAVS